MGISGSVKHIRLRDSHTNFKIVFNINKNYLSFMTKVKYFLDKIHNSFTISS